MSTLLLVHRGEAAVERDAAAGLAASLRGTGHDVRCTWEQRGVAGGQVAALELAAATADRALLVDPVGWWSRGPVDEWRRSVWQLVDYAAWSQVDRFAVAITRPTRSEGRIDAPLERLPRFVLPDGWGGLVEWIGGPRAEVVLPSTERLPTRPSRIRANESALAVLDKAVGAGSRKGGDLVWIRGAAGTGKSALLGEWLRRRASTDVVPICHVARPGIAWSHDPDQVLAKFIRVLLGPDFAGSLEDALARLDQRSERAIVVVDGLEQIASHLAGGRERLRSLFAGKKIPRSVTVIATSRALAPGELAREPTIDLDADSWRNHQRDQVEQIIRNAASGSAWAELLIEHAAGNLGLAAALLDAHADPFAGDVPVELELPSAITGGLERSWTAMLSRAGPQRSLLRSGLAISMAARESLPVSLHRAALREDEREVVRTLASEWLREAGGRVGFVHPCVRRFLAPELDVLDATPHVRLLDAMASLKVRASLDLAAAAYAKEHAREHRLACHGFDAGLSWVTDVEFLVSLAERGALVARLEGALELADPERRGLVEHALAVARRRRSELSENPAALASHLWTELVGAGMPAAELLHWGAMLPPIRLTNAIDYRERSYLRLEHSGDVRGCAIDADANRAITVTSDRQLHVWSVRTGERLAKLDIGAWAEGCAISSDGTRAVVGAGRRVSLWDLDQKTMLAHHDEHGGDVTTVSMSSDGRTLLSADRSGDVWLWQVDRNRQSQLGSHGEVVRCSALSSNGRLAMTGDDDKRVFVWDIERQERVQTLSGHSYGVGGVALTSTGELGISVCIGEARVWEPRSGRLIDTHGDLGMSTHGCVLVDGGKEAIVAESGPELHRWTVVDGHLRTRHFAHAQDMTCVAATPDGKWSMTGGQDHLARVWQSETVAGIDEYPHARAITGLCASVENCVWVAGGSNIRRVSLVDGRELLEIEQSGVQAIFEAGDRVVAGGSGRKVEVYARSRQAELASWDASKDWIRACAVDPSHTYVAYAGDEKVVFCSDFEGKQLARFTGHGDWVRELAWTSDGRLVSVDDDGELRIWDIGKKTCVLQCQPLDSGIYALVVEGERAFVGGVAGKLASVDLRRGKTLACLEAHPTPITDLALAEQGLLVSAGRDATLRIWSIDDTDGRMLARYDGIYPFTRVVVVEGKIVAGDAAGNYLVLEVDWPRLLAG